MIGWKIECEIQGESVIAEIASQPTPEVRDGFSYGVQIMVYYGGKLHLINMDEKETIKVIEKK